MIHRALLNENKTNTYTPKKKKIIRLKVAITAPKLDVEVRDHDTLFLALPPASDIFLQLPTLSLMRTLSEQQF